MPLYEYACDACGHRLEIIQKFSDGPPDACPKCGKGLMKPILETTELTPQAIKTSLRARCTDCGYEDTATVSPQD